MRLMTLWRYITMQLVCESNRDVPLVVVLEDETDVGGVEVEENDARPLFVRGGWLPVVLRRT